METAMELHIEDLEKTKMIMEGLHNVDSTTLTAIQSCIDNAKHYLAKEKEQIMTAAEFDSTRHRAESYYKTTYTTKK